MEKIALWTRHKILNIAEDEIACLTFLTTQSGVWRIIPLMIWTYCTIKWHFPGIKFYSLSLMLDQKPRMHFFDMRLSLASFSLISLLELKKLCMKFEKNRYGFRKADIDVYIFNRKSNQLSKLSHKLLPVF